MIDFSTFEKLTPEQKREFARLLGPALRAVEQSEADKVDVAQWMERKFWIPDLMTPTDPEPHKGLILLMPHIKALLRFIFDPKRSITDYFQTIIYTVPKKSAKTSISAGVGRWIVEQWGPYSDVVFVANDREQAKGRAYEYATRSIALTPGWDQNREELPASTGTVGGNADAAHQSQMVEWYTSQQGAFFHDGGKMRAIAKDYKGEAGANQNAAIFTEIAFMSEERARRLWDELTPPPTRRAIRWAEGYAGFLGEGVLWQELWELFRDIDDASKITRGARRLTRDELEPYGGWVDWRGEPFRLPDGTLEDPPIYINEEARAVGYIDQGMMARRMPWQVGEIGAAYYAAQERTERPEAMRRLHFNEWASPVDTFIPPEWWDACRLDFESATGGELPSTVLAQRASEAIGTRAGGERGTWLPPEPPLWPGGLR